MKDSPIASQTTSPLTFDAAVARAREAIAREGMGVLTEIDVQATLNPNRHEATGTPTLGRIFAVAPLPAGSAPAWFQLLGANVGRSFCSQRARGQPLALTACRDGAERSSWARRGSAGS